MKKNLLLTGVLGASMLALAACGDDDTGADEEVDDTNGDTEEVEDEDGDEDAEGDDDAAAGGDDDAYADVAGETFTVATDNNFVPFAFMDLDTNELSGFDIELMTALADEMGIEVNFETMEFQGALAGIQSGVYDASINAMSITEERQDTIDFSDPYYLDAGIIVAVAADNEGEWGSLEELDQDGITIATNQGSTSHDYLDENLENASIQALPDVVEAYQNVIQGHSDAVLYDEPNVLYYVEEQAQGQLVTVGDTLLADDYGIGMPQGHELVDPINHALEVLMENGTYDDIYEDYFGERPMGT
ncbi:transporter substrate-binding domain-containing protein [Geomicrobium sp. JSM 1781026]|uniref:transporter substrate-binding domain-containing protein n=1 Tax=Geomicrobium sp. JSM 1781026 TaxID=3344580 RepID=UPI0035C1A824